MNPQAASTYPTTIAKPTTPDESQELSENPRFRTWYKGTLTRSEIYERVLPDKETKSLRIDGPEDSTILQNNLGQIKIITGQKDTERGPGSGKLCIRSWGQQQRHEHRSNLEFNAGDDTDEGQALNVLCYGDYVEKTTGGTRYIRAQKIVIEASEELLLIGKTQVNIQAGTAGGGAIIMNAGSIERTASQDKEIITGQKMTFGVSEETKVQFDPRASQNIVSPGHINWSILGDYKQWIGGVEQHIVAGGPGLPPLIKARDSTYSVKTTIGGQTYDSTDFISVKAGLNYNMTAGGIANLTATGAMNIKGALILLN
ncbi:baseplate hub and tail lysozyme [Synechococcus phage ACG-2014e]|jgi:hypothetical protein|uniref:Putative base plate lysozyme n=1 Tax=Synechococcus phage ACG-2014e TaxID=1493510 RepID=A0A0E3I946_9CAUD|nr:baseplate hub and tail lysozyme [Synechococcus phage ACG-2014e]YP_010355624.1 baseplate hub and tail lysozyme [Synechococcus phage ACG-2014e]AIX20475.1 putative base plate lysozyme [Synechococcus phage ACG-2014e]AIX29693.1 putative base plate lysozyme [Synechococcus phage ACG-2014e]AIX44931.1 putative base plate lysozyme [Synechococcus phage ACG-2014e]